LARKLNILICPLDWGLGHASRDIPIIKNLVERGHNVIVAGGEYPLELICEEFPTIEYIPFANFKITYPKKGSIAFHFLKLLPKLILSIRKEHCQLKKIIKDKNIDVVISDNRFGLWNKATYSVFITHQVMIKMPEKLKFAEYLMYRFNRFFIYKYNRCWIPDNEAMPYLAGDLSHKYSLNGKTSYVGLLSRFSECAGDKSNEFNEPFEVMAIVSGPEPHRANFEQLLLSQMQRLNCRCLLIKGVPEKVQTREQVNNVLVYSHLNTCQMKQAIQNSNNLICRAGYSTIMDLIALKRTAVLVPTPGQTEQEYLAEYYALRKMFVVIKQDELRLTDALAKISVYSWTYMNPEENLLENEIEKLENEFSL
jgi:predicted glycosyltransferase